METHALRLYFGGMIVVIFLTNPESTSSNEIQKIEKINYE
jgi:hypothetical protein